MTEPIETKTYDSILEELMSTVDPKYRQGFESIFENALDREQAFSVVVLAVEEQLSQVDSTELSEIGRLRTQFHHISNMAVLGQLVDLCGLGIYKDQIIQERIKVVFGPEKK